MTETTRSRLLWAGSAVLILLLAFALRVWDAGYGDLTFDEIATHFIAKRTPRGVLRYLAGAVREHPPLYYLITSLWFSLAGTEELIARLPSALFGVLGVAWGVRLGRRWLGREGGWWGGLLLAVMPFSIWVGRTARMYSLVMLLALVIVDLWWSWVRRPTTARWALFVALSLAGILTHYYLIFLWPVEGLMLLLFPRRTRPIRWRWVATVVAGALVLGGLMVSFEGLRATVLATAGRFPARALRPLELRSLLLDLYLNWHHHTLLPAALALLALTVGGWFLAARRSLPVGVLLALWGLVPALILALIPEAIEARYAMAGFPALALGLGAFIALLRPHALRLVAALLVLVEFGYRWDHLYLPPTTDFSEQVGLLRAAAAPEDALLLNGPWQGLLFSYYPGPAELPLHPVPAAAPPGFVAEVDVPRLEALLEEHERLWVSYAAVKSADPDFAVSRWLAENAYAVFRHRNLLLYLPPPDAALETVVEGVSFGPRHHLERAAVGRREVTPGEALRVRTDWVGEGLNWGTHLALALLDEEGRVWQRYDFSLGPVLHDEDALPREWSERRGLWVQPGVPPGTYTLGLRVTGQGAEAPEGAVAGEWLPLTRVDVPSKPFAAPPPALPRWGDAEATFAGALELAGLSPENEELPQGFPLDFSLWWWAREDAPHASHLKVRLSGPATTTARTFELGPPFHPITEWREGEVVRQEVRVELPRDLPPGRYGVEVQVVGADGDAWPVRGARRPLTPWEYLPGRHPRFEGEWGDLFAVRVVELPRDYRPPLVRERVDVRFGDVLRLRGYRVEAREARPGESVEVTQYWQAQRPPDRIYAVFNHLIGPEGEVAWQQDSWPRGGEHTTDRWVEGEVVAERYVVEVPQDALPGEYTYYVGAYDPATVARLPAVDAAGSPYLNAAVPLFTLTVTAEEGR